MLEGSVFSHLSTTTALTALVGTRIYPLVLPQAAAFPAVTYQRVGAGRDYHLGGFGNLDRASIQMDVWSTSYGSVKPCSTVLIAAMEGATAFKAECDDITDLYEDVAQMYRVSLDFSIWFRG